MDESSNIMVRTAEICAHYGVVATVTGAGLMLRYTPRRSAMGLELERVDATYLLGYTDLFNLKDELRDAVVRQRCELLVRACS